MSDVSHDLRSPMTSISGFIDGIIDGVIPPEKHEYYLRIISDEVKRLSRLVTTLLDLSRIQAGKRKFAMSEFDICEMARQILISFEQKINAKKLDVSFEMDEDRMNVIADRDAIYQVLYNLCDNAVKFSADSGRLSISIRRIKGRKVQIEVFNEGAGVSSEDINYVFERFYKSDKSRGLNKSGAGLGLFISKTIMDAHDQKIWVDSEPGKNCCFSFTLESE
jgi:signal transduction histidine kinase